MRLRQHLPDRTDKEPKVLACYGLLRTDTKAMLLRFVEERPVSSVTTQFLARCAECLAAENKRVLVLVWDNAAWHVSREVRTWIKAHNRLAKAEGGVRIRVCRLPSRSRWLNPIEPKWVHSKRQVFEPDRKLTGAELNQRICDFDRCALLDPLAKQVS